jgi:hypothetical protein
MLGLRGRSEGVDLMILRTCCRPYMWAPQAVWPCFLTLDFRCDRIWGFVSLSMASCSLFGDSVSDSSLCASMIPWDAGIFSLLDISLSPASRSLFDTSVLNSSSCVFMIP